MMTKCMLSHVTANLEKKEKLQEDLHVLVCIECKRIHT